MSNFKELLSKVKAFAFDVDGVFAKSNFYLDAAGEYVRSMNIKDGYAVQLAVKKGYPIAIITGGNSLSVKKRFNDLGITDIYLNSSYKLDNFNDFRFKYNIEPENILYMGDDLPDYEVMKAVGIPTSPADAAEEIHSISRYISNIKGGEGCVRDVIEQVMRAQGKWMDNDAFHW
ncbi:MAG TPA: 3-deoxy-D-manno-octulosonate 8-phosphate phosphatase [Bacteroidales bacterium]|nr:MAG: 3-deoxy-D-manno-octulosonate 8-phosphate phosphatase [Bacteroidetes bacterium GWF2_33_38]OFY90422.1 MAG: 3-deoxy-D-manno-octulosonate 8-phosphate phosphatase [Bacteroidetes bacterium RIFOXYA2_FULL_33_7]HBF89037.1 3-deoxy-D-manno-octulosonate 8-phosphate phosphatase [Bacteroidales bacterium]